jgi:hypothetical protein
VLKSHGVPLAGRIILKPASDQSAAILWVRFQRIAFLVISYERRQKFETYAGRAALAMGHHFAKKLVFLADELAQTRNYNGRTFLVSWESGISTMPASRSLL